jgi:hypothetical protein
MTRLFHRSLVRWKGSAYSNAAASGRPTELHRLELYQLGGDPVNAKPRNCPPHSMLSPTPHRPPAGARVPDVEDRRLRPKPNRGIMDVGATPYREPSDKEA